MRMKFGGVRISTSFLADLLRSSKIRVLFATGERKLAALG